MKINGNNYLITGGARRIGREIALALASRGANIVVHHSNSNAEANEVAEKIQYMGQKAWVFQADFAKANDVTMMCEYIETEWLLQGIINNASIFLPQTFLETTREDWERNFSINLTTPFQLSQALARSIMKSSSARIINILDWRALRPGKDHFAYTISKAALAAMTKSLAIDLAPNITVNGIALGAILPPSDNGGNENILRNVPAGRWGTISELIETIIFLLEGPEYISGEIIHLDGGRHLV
jgi:NAD(P)-dependent dehydrogenase (short-subunit alcohol dehydrogenase family)